MNWRKMESKGQSILNKVTEAGQKSCSGNSSNQIRVGKVSSRIDEREKHTTDKKWFSIDSQAGN